MHVTLRHGPCNDLPVRTLLVLLLLSHILLILLKLCEPLLFGLFHSLDIIDLSLEHSPEVLLLLTHRVEFLLF
jgi:hypothetical protein